MPLPRAVCTSFLLASLLLGGCAELVPLKVGAEQVKLVELYDARQCQLLGSTRVSVLGKLGPIERDTYKVEAELARLARNAALEMNGDTVAPASVVVDGARDFKVLRCR